MTQFPILFTYIDIYGFWGPLIKQGIILVISIVTLQNCFGDLGEMCGKYSRWLKVPGPLDIGPFLTQFPIVFAYIYIYMGFGGPIMKEGIILDISIVTLQNCFSDLGEMRGKYPRWLKVPGPLDIGPFLTQFLFYLRILIYMVFRGPVIKEGIILFISIVTLQNCFGDLVRYVASTQDG